MAYRIDEKEYEDLIGSVYDAALDPERWPSLLQEIALCVNAHAAQLVALKNDTSQFFENTIVGLDLDIVVPEFEYHIQNGTHVRALDARNAAELTTRTDFDHTSEIEMRRHEFYIEHAIPNDIPYYGATILKRSEDVFVTNVLLRSQSAGHFTKKDVDFLNRLAPHLRRSFEISIRVSENGAKLGLQSFVSRLQNAAVILDSQKKILFANESAQLLFHSRDLVADDNLSFCCINGDANRAFSREFKFCLNATSGITTNRNGTLRVSGASLGSSAVLHMVPVNSNSFFPRYGRIVLVLICMSSDAFAFPNGYLKDGFGLTDAESEVADLLVNGCSVSEISDIRARSIMTIRGQLKSILAKSGCTSQSQPIRKLITEFAMFGR